MLRLKNEPEGKIQLRFAPGVKARSLSVRKFKTLKYSLRLKRSVRFTLYELYIV